MLPEPSKGKKGKKRAAEPEGSVPLSVVNDFGVEYSKSSRAECVGCHNKIFKDDLRVKKTVYDTEVGAKFGGQALWHHLSCFASIRGDYGYYLSGEQLPGYKQLSSVDRKAVKEAIK